MILQREPKSVAGYPLGNSSFHLLINNPFPCKIRALFVNMWEKARASSVFFKGKLFWCKMSNNSYFIYNVFSICSVIELFLLKWLQPLIALIIF